MCQRLLWLHPAPLVKRNHHRAIADRLDQISTICTEYNTVNSTSFDTAGSMDGQEIPDSSSSSSSSSGGGGPVNGRADIRPFNLVAMQPSDSIRNFR